MLSIPNSNHIWCDKPSFFFYSKYVRVDLYDTCADHVHIFYQFCLNQHRFTAVKRHRQTETYNLVDMDRYQLKPPFFKELVLRLHRKRMFELSERARLWFLESSFYIEVLDKKMCRQVELKTSFMYLTAPSGCRGYICSL